MFSVINGRRFNFGWFKSYLSIKFPSYSTTMSVQEEKKIQFGFFFFNITAINILCTVRTHMSSILFPFLEFVRVFHFLWSNTHLGYDMMCVRISERVKFMRKYGMNVPYTLLWSGTHGSGCVWVALEFDTTLAREYNERVLRPVQSMVMAVPAPNLSNNRTWCRRA